jgi:cytochrome c nitrite reductase small subunit
VSQRGRSVAAWLTALAVLIGIGGGIGLFTFHYAEGLSYFSNDPRECINCHIMNDQYDSWLKSPHHVYATCNDCHTPHALLPKLVTKADNGWNHSKKFTLGTWGDPIRIREVNRQRLQSNCIRCHGDFVHDVRLLAAEERPDRPLLLDAWRAICGAEDELPPGQEIDCVRCHAGIGHGPKR